MESTLTFSVERNPRYPVYAVGFLNYRRSSNELPSRFSRRKVLLNASASAKTPMNATILNALAQFAPERYGTIFFLGKLGWKPESQLNKIYQTN
jgi:hypothetical protein